MPKAKGTYHVQLVIHEEINMSWRFRRIFRSGPFRWSWSKKGVGWSIGFFGLRYGVSPTGQSYISFGIPRTGFYYIKYLSKKQSNPSSRSLPQPPPPQPLPPPQAPPSTPSQTNKPWWKNP